MVAAIVDEQWVQMTGIGENHGSRGRIEHSIHHGDKLSGRKIVD
jgi:hypothetical protein